MLFPLCSYSYKIEQRALVSLKDSRRPSVAATRNQTGVKGAGGGGCGTNAVFHGSTVCHIAWRAQNDACVESADTRRSPVVRSFVRSYTNRMKKKRSVERHGVAYYTMNNNANYDVGVGCGRVGLIVCHCVSRPTDRPTETLLSRSP